MPPRQDDAERRHRNEWNYRQKGVCNVRHCDPESPNDEVERRGVALTPNEADLSRSSIPSLAHRSRAPRSLEPIVRRRPQHTRRGWTEGESECRLRAGRPSEIRWLRE
jgi:hypothetical protein